MITVPEQYQKDLSAVRDMSDEVNKRDPGLGDMAVMSALGDIGNRSVLFIGISGTGKSTVAYWVRAHVRRNKIMPHGVTVNGLKAYAEQLDNNSTTIIVEDLSRSGTDYMQINTVAVLSGIVYTSAISKHNATLNLEITGMHGSALVYAQPLIMKKLVRVPEFESDISDKTLRYYHLVKPITPHPEDDPLNPQLTDGKPWGSIDRQKIKYDPMTAVKYWDRIIDNFTCEVSLARAIEHSQALMKASALLNGRESVTEADAWLIEFLSRDFRIEEEIYTKRELEGERYLDPNLLPLLTIMVTYRTPTVKLISKSFRLQQAQTYEIVKKLGLWVQLNGGKLHATEKCTRLLKELGLW